jgi:hypothetical protein
MLGKVYCYIKKLGILLTTFALIAGMVGCDGYTPPSKDLEIQDWYDLDEVRNNLAGHHILMNDLNSTTAGYTALAGPTANGGKGWQPIGFYTPYGPTAYVGLTGTFDGQGHEIRDLYINRPDEDRVGLFGETHESVIKDMCVLNVTAIGRDAVGGLAGTIGWNGTVSNCYSTGNIAGRDAVAGLVGANWGTLSNCYSNSKTAGISRVGGLVGVTGPAQILSNSYSTGSVTGVNDVGGLVGSNVVYEGHGTGVNNSFWDRETSGLSTSAGGTGMNTTEMRNIATFSDVETDGLDQPWNIITVALNETNPAYIWNIVNNVTYPFLSWQS